MAVPKTKRSSVIKTITDIKTHNLQAQVEQLQEVLRDRTKNEIKALIEQYGDPQYKASEFAFRDVISVAHQLYADNVKLQAELQALKESFRQYKTDAIAHTKKVQAELALYQKKVIDKAKQMLEGKA